MPISIPVTMFGSFLVWQIAYIAGPPWLGTLTSVVAALVIIAATAFSIVFDRGVLMKSINELGGYPSTVRARIRSGLDRSRKSR